ncbi:MAG: hypothetical protein WAK84_01245 [Candidatus Cybelea sp.]
MREIRAARGKSVEPFEWEQRPAISQLTMTTWSVYKPYRENQSLRPSDFLAVAIIKDSRDPVYQAIEEIRGSRPCCKQLRPSCALFSDLSQLREQGWRCLRCGEPWDFDVLPHLKTYGDLIRHTLQGVARKRLCADGSEPTRASRGATIPRPVEIETVTMIGKEIIVDPTNTDEGLTAEMLSSTEIVEYHDPAERLDALRAEIRAIGINRVVAKSGMDRRTAQRFCNAGTSLRSSSINKLNAAAGPAKIAAVAHCWL